MGQKELLLDGDQLLGMFVRGALGRSGRKQAKRVVQVVGGHRGLLSTSTLLAAAGIAWGIYESMQSRPAPTPAVPSTPGHGPTPPLPIPTGAASAAPVAPPEVIRVVRLAVSAANADGGMTEAERAAIRQHGERAGVGSLVEQELVGRRPLAEIVAGVTSDAERRDLYTLAFAIVRADEGVSGAERIYLAQLAHALSLTADATASLERDASTAIDGGDTPA